MAAVRDLFLPFSPSSESSKRYLAHQKYPSRRCQRRSAFTGGRRNCPFRRHDCHHLLSRCLSIDRVEENSDAPLVTVSETSSAPLRFVFTGGGSGGHIYPAIAIADEIKSLYPDSKFLFVGTASGMESRAVPTSGYDFEAIPASRLIRPIFSPENLILPFCLLQAMAVAWKILQRFRPQAVIGTGGFVAAPVCLAAALSGIKIVIQEQNSFPGIVNKIVSPFAAKIFLAFNACSRHFPDKKCLVYGNPVRLSLRRFASKAAARSNFFPTAAKFWEEKAQVVLVLGGSQGASTINIAVLNMYYDMLLQHKNRYIIWQTGQDGYNEMESLVKNHRRLLLTPFLHAMDMAYAAADVTVSRAGAMTCTEILTTGKPSILIPSPYVAEDHQTYNASIMAEIAGSKILTEDELDSSSLVAVIDEVLGDEKLMADMSSKALKSALPNAATDIAQSILSLVSKSSLK
ncbi:UDP-N-acetylglucosamine--N-acetylmuramyl-(pentapeptide) pyrophosphoryl-undecaprenol N-acetylglucosamine transferase [Apostasia shenzhenica]|uniref:UDP-N-acetylglucosamine--N-acetylmuramyl-(Pentapeptide) pyrophosphoryl-undecaprenol N-acetylglucosamine transferase n=1 Tax=Apostasia shenzhenica TaxID=1088818 RepID=A0A2H9ZVC6_9ASPA|nr:UDP-N-acetylglucosamine--N-acetylmuramyl-(pentapeptide) pyrophosphoryl-undecaprenol N-acetylglucosamine transferase [Apostasia shenzhenica]